ncbi:uncharacterized protein Tco025E_06747 [Trypanosoma conorhini]|uniref:Uncharacterized protein n=1 Tax=Trypanosoma conorhini TaxID=83891 RepID=A0A3R7M801_9TRYP|nr:uncharacterized protein Tco025E_06747 [Trypanosoma conorhini]RNF10733.1 hypothetical protein Tco025E_06747 [Trypanosoma conorhini]
MPPKRKKSASRGKKKRPKVFVDPDEEYRRALDERYYLPKLTRAAINQGYLQRILLAIKSFTLAQPPLELETLDSREEEVNREIATRVPLQVLPDIVRSLGLNPGEEQMRQIGWLVLYHGESPRRPPSEAGDAGTAVPPPEAAPQEPHAEAKEQVEVTLEEMLDHPLEETVASAAGRGKKLMADRGKLEAVLLDIMCTGLLVFDPAGMQGEAAAPAHERVVSVVDRSDPEVVDNVFDVLWAASLRHRCEDGARCIYVSDLEHLLTAVQEAAAIGELPLTPEELEAFFFFVSETGCDTVREDTFALMAL